MVYDYVVTLENRNRRSIDNISVLLLFLSIAFFIEQTVRSLTGVKQDNSTGIGWSSVKLTVWENKFILFGTLLLVCMFGFALYQYW